MGPETIHLGYVWSLAAMSVVTALVGVAVYARDEGRHRKAFAAYTGTVTVWIAIAPPDSPSRGPGRSTR